MKITIPKHERDINEPGVEAECAKCGHKWPGSWEKANCPSCGLNVKIGVKCKLCGGYVPCGEFSGANCEKCGMRYEYEEGVFMAPTKEQYALFAKAMKIER